MSPFAGSFTARRGSVAAATGVLPTIVGVSATAVYGTALAGSVVALQKNGTALPNPVTADGAGVWSFTPATAPAPGEVYVASAAVSSASFTVPAAGGGPAATSKITTEGDSITAGAGLLAGQDWPSKLAVLSGLTVSNIGTSGYTFASMDADYASRAGTQYDGSRSVNELFLLGGANDLKFNGATASQLQGWATSLVGKAKATGYAKVWVGTILPATSDHYGTAAEAARTAFNAWIRANYAAIGASGVVDYASQTGLTDPSSTTYFQDGLHPTAPGTTIMAAAAHAARSAGATASWTDIFGSDLLFAGDPSSLQATAGTATAWNDTSGLGHHMTAYGSPPVGAAGVTLNGTRGFRRSGFGLPAGTPVNAWAIATPTAVAQYGRIVAAAAIGQSDIGAAGMIPLCNYNNDAVFFFQTAGSSVTPVTIGSAALLEGLMSSTTAGRTYVNAVPSASADQPVNLAGVSLDVICIGTKPDSLDEGFVGIIERLVVTKGVPTALQRQKAEGKLAWDAGRSALLPAGHPYKSAGPAPSPAPSTAGQPTGLLLLLTKAA